MTKVFVTGPQRSGSTFVSHCVSHDLGIPHFDEGLFDAADYDKFLEIAKENEDWVIHGPALLHRVLDIQAEFPTVEFVVLRRNIADIVASQGRINWFDAQERDSFKAWDDPRPIAEIKYEFWDSVKLQLLHWREYDYEDFKNHKLWLDKELRGGFHAKQWQIES